MNFRSILFFSIIINILNVFNIHAQTSVALTGHISGVIQDIKTGEVISYGTAALMNTKDSSLAGGSVTDENGNFTIESVPFGSYYLKFSFIGYKTFKTENFVLNESQPEKKFGVLKLKSSVTSLNAVTVVGK